MLSEGTNFVALKSARHRIRLKLGNPNAVVHGEL